jgi:CRP-like cAMP-binding protein
MHAAGATLPRTGWLADTPPDFRDLVLHACDVLCFKATERIYEDGDNAGGIFGVVAGALEVHLPWRGSRSTLSHIGGPGFWTGAGTAITGAPRRVTIAARASSCLLRLPRAAVVEITRNDPSTHVYFSALNARNLFLAIDIVNALKCTDALERVTATLLNLVGCDSAKQPVIHASQSDLASIAGLGHSSVSVAVTNLERRGWLRRRYAAIEITDLTALQRSVEIT